MNYAILIFVKMIKFILNKFGKGTSLPGKIAFKLNKNILNYFQMPKNVVFVTGTTGKTSVTGILNQILKQNDYKVYSNIKGSNLIYGVISTLIEASKLNGKTKADALVIEIDERYVKKVYKYITPNYFIITNLSRDQLARNGHFELVFNEINNSIRKETTLILNADDPLVTKFSLNKDNKIIYYGISKNKYSTNKNKIETLDMGYCPICHKKLIYDYFNYGNLGYYHCPNNDYIRPKCNYEANLLKNKFSVEDVKINLEEEVLYYIYNLLACYSTARTIGIESKKIEKVLNNLNLKVKRLNEFKVKDNKGIILLSKNETPLSYNQSLEYISKKKEKKTVAIGFTRISGRYDLKDISWIYDINFELLNDDSIEKIILIGPFAYDLAVRLKQAKIDPKKFVYCLDYKNSLDFCIDKSIGNLYFVVYFDLNYMYIDQLKERKLL